MITLIDPGLGNIKSVRKAFDSLGAGVRLVNKGDDLDGAGKVVLPGVGSFAANMEGLRSGGFVEPLRRHIAAGKPFLGICVGLQVLFERSFENGEHAGLGVLEGEVGPIETDGKLPQIGWNDAKIVRPSPLLEGVADGTFFYFVHSYCARPTDKNVVALETTYGETYPSFVSRGNLFAAQFHPEKSQRAGLKILENFVRLPEAS